MTNYTYPEPVLEEISNAVGLVEEIPTGLCANCSQRNNCGWRENNKIFCEHYL